MFLPKLLIAGAVCVGCGVPVAFELLRNKGTELEGLVFTKADEVTKPILTCSGNGSRFELSLAYRNGDGETKELYWRGFNRKDNREINLNGTTDRNEVTYNLTIFGTGTIRLGPITGSTGQFYSDATFNCNKDVFEVKKWDTSSGEKNTWFWERSFDKIKLTPDNECENKNGKQVCDINISEDVGLKWKPDFKPKAIF